MFNKNARIELYYRQKSSIADLQSPYFQQEIIRHLLDKHSFLSSNKKIRIMDYGTGIGSNIKTLRQCGYKSIVAIDISPKAIEICKNKFKNKTNIKFLVLKNKHLPFKDGIFDLVICTEVLEHVADLKLVTDELKRVTSRNGYLLVSAPNYFNLTGFIKFYFDLFSKEKDWNPWGAHKGGFERLFFWFNLRCEFNDKFELIEDQGRDLLLSWFYLLRRYIPNKFSVFLLLLPKQINWLKYFSMNYYILFRKNED